VIFKGRMKNDPLNAVNPSLSCKSIIIDENLKDSQKNIEMSSEILKNV
jgi:hypothetical protein